MNIKKLPALIYSLSLSLVLTHSLAFPEIALASQLGSIFHTTDADFNAGNYGSPAQTAWNQTSGTGASVVLNLDTSTYSWQTSTIDSTGSVGWFTSIALGSDGYGRIAYYDGTNGNLNFVQCTNADCSTHSTPVAVDSTGDVGMMTSIALGPDGYARISYYDTTNTNLKFVQCTNADCSTHSTPVAVDSTGDVGQTTSLKIGSNGTPRISYYDNTNYDLKFAYSFFPYYSSGTYTSLPIQRAQVASWGNLSYTKTGTGSVAMRARSCATAAESSCQHYADGWSYCGTINNGDGVKMASPDCVSDSDKFIQYQATLTGDTTTTPSLDDITLDYQYNPDTTTMYGTVKFFGTIIFK